MSIMIEKATPADAQLILDYLKQVGSETDNLTFGCEGMPFSVEAEASYIAQIEESCDEIMLVAKENGKVIGNASLSRLPRRMGHRGDFCVAVVREYWNKGVGSKLLSKIIDFAKANSFEIIDLQVRSDNLRAIHIYEKFGFQKTGTHPAFFKINDEYISFDYMYLNLKETIMKINTETMKWIRVPKQYTITEDRIEIITEPFTDLWQRTYYHFRNDNAPVLQMTTDDKYFSFVVKTEFDTKVRYDQSGVVMYLDSENWLKASVEYENERIQRLGSVVTNHGYSDWASMDVDASIKSMWFRLSRRENDFCIENSMDGEHFNQMRICHMFNANDTIQFGIYACSAENSSFKATFTNMEITECKWSAHDGQAPDEEE